MFQALLCPSPGARDCDVVIYLFLFIMRSSDPYKAKSPLDIELVNG